MFYQFYYVTPDALSLLALVWHLGDGRWVLCYNNGVADYRRTAKADPGFHSRRRRTK